MAVAASNIKMAVRSCGSVSEAGPDRRFLRVHDILEQQPPVRPKVFISYAHDPEDKAHRRRVLELAERLRSNRIDARIDQYMEDGPVEWPEWTERQIRDADLVLVVCTALYRAAFEDETPPGAKKGSKWEARFIRRHVYACDSVNDKFVAVLPEGGSPDHIPGVLQGSMYYSPIDEPGYLSLYRRITGQPSIVARPLGSPLDLPPESIPLPPLPDKAMAEQAKAYLQRLREETGEIRIGSIDRGSSQASSFPISRVYVPLHFVMNHEAGEPKRTRLEAVLGSRKAVIQGDAGSGKSTFMRCAAFDLCHDEPGTTPLELPERGFPLYIRVSELDAHLTRIWGRGAEAPKGSPTRETDPGWLGHFLATLEWGASQAFFEAKLRHAKTVLLLDGLDEAPSEPSRERMAKLLGEASRRYPECRIVVTTRPQALRGEVRPAGFADVSIAPFDDDSVALFIERWCSCKYADEPGKAEREREKLAQALRFGEIAELAKNPLMLAALTVIHFNGGQLPDNRLELYEAIVRWMAEARKHALHANWQDRLENLRLLALGMQTRAGGRVRGLETGEAAELLRPKLTMKDALRCLQVEEADGGILAMRGENVEFVHLTFQEYLAALELAGQDPEEIHETIWRDGRLYSPEWREVMRFLAGILRNSGPRRVKRLFDAIVGRTEGTLAGRARTVALLATLRMELRRRDGEGKEIEFRIANDRYDCFVREMAGLFGPVDRAPELDARTCAEAAEEWERLGDVSGLHLPSSPDYWVDLGKFRMGRYPVTVFEYGTFVEAGGPEPSGWEEQSKWPYRPVVRVDWQQAMNYCAWAGCRLATSDEWDLAAAGEEGREYPWGAEAPDRPAADRQRANFDNRVGRVTPVGLFPAGTAPEGIADLAGNVWEWTDSDYDETTKVVRGGAFNYNAWALRAAFRYRNDPEYRDVLIGFRCVRE